MWEKYYYTLFIPIIKLYNFIYYFNIVLTFFLGITIETNSISICSFKEFSKARNPLWRFLPVSIQGSPILSKVEYVLNLNHAVGSFVTTNCFHFFGGGEWRTYKCNIPPIT